MNTDAYNLALRRLNSRDYSSHELCGYLARKGFATSDAAEVVASLVESRFIDDARYGAALARAQARRGKGPTYIRNKLKQKGVELSVEEIRRVAAQAEGKSEIERAREIVERRYPEFKSDKAAAVKAMQALVRRGFSYDIARQAVGAPGTRQLDEL